MRLDSGGGIFMEFQNVNGKNVNIEVDGDIYMRHTIQTHFVKIGESYIDIIEKYVKPLYEEGDFISISEKIIALCQKRIVYKSDLKVGFWAKFLSKFASKSTHGIGVNSELKMAYCIKKAGLPKTIYAAVRGGLGKLFRKRGVFYEIVGQDVSGLDGFYPNVFKEYGNYGIENPEHPFEVCKEIEEKTGIPCMLVDANDLGQELLGYSPTLKKRFTERQLLAVIKDNPAGQGNKCTPIVLIRKNDKKTVD